MLSWTQRVFYRSRITAAMLDKGGTPFEDWFVDLASRKWGTNFEPVRAQGRKGDLKCDGHRVSDGTIFQCYGPRSADKKKTRAKIKEDFEGAREIWKERMKRWTIVINDREGLDAQATKEVEQLRFLNPSLAIEVMGPRDIERLALNLPHEDLADLCEAKLDELGYERWRLSFADIAKVVGELSLADLPADSSLAPPPPDKILRNNLDEEIATLLRKGNILVGQVESFFRATGDVELEGRVAQSLAQAYADSKEAELEPSHIFYVLVELCGGLARPQGERVAVLGIVTYFFNKCVVFEALEFSGFGT